MIEWLLERKYNINNKDSKGRTILLKMISLDNYESVKYLLNIKSLKLKEQQDNDGKNPIHYLVEPKKYGSYENT